MPTLFFIALGALVAVAGLVTVYALCHAELGYEDEAGFHFGSPPQQQRPPTFIQSVLIYHRVSPDQGAAGAGRNMISQLPSARAVDSGTSPRSRNRA